MRLSGGLPKAASAGVHDVAARGFEVNVAEYERARPTYPLSAVKEIIGGVAPTTLPVLDLACGTGKLTHELVKFSLPALEALEPSVAMREFFQAKFPALTVREGTASHIPAADGTFAAIFVGQAFHWFDTEEALCEMHRVLRPGGKLALIWNLEDDSVPWVKKVRGEYERYDQVAPQFRRGTWRNVWKGELARSLFKEPMEKEFTHSLMMDHQRVWERVKSKSYIGILPADEQERLKACIDRILQAHIGAPGPEFPYPQKTTTFIAWKR